MATSTVASGVAALERGELALAQTLLQRAYEQAPSASGLCQLGRLRLRQGLHILAQDFLRRCLADAGELGQPLAPALEAEATRLLAAASDGSSQPLSSGEVIALSSRGGLLAVDDLLSASLRPGGSVQLSLPVGRHQLRLTSPAQGVVTLSVLVESQLLTEVDFDRQQLATSTPILLLPLGERGPLAVDSAKAVALAGLLGPPLRKENGLLVGPARLRPLLRQQAGLFRCSDRFDCQLRLGRLAEASFVLSLRQTPESDAASPPAATDYRLEAWLTEAHAGQQTAHEEQRCAGCTQRELDRALVELTLRLFERGRRPARMVEVAASPPAKLRIDGESRGQTPQRIWLLPGEHRVELSRPYFYPQQAQLLVDEDATDKVPQFAYPLTPTPLSPGERAGRYLAAIGGGLGVATVAVGIGLLLRPDQAVAPQSLPAAQPELPGFVTTTQPPAIGLLIGGGALVATAATLLIIDRYRHAQRRKH